MSQEIITFSLDTEKIKALDEIARVFDRDRTSPLNQAIAPNPQLYQSTLLRFSAKTPATTK